MENIWIAWIIAYILVGLIMAFTVEGLGKWDRLIFVVWPIPIILFMIFSVYAIIRGLYIEISKYIKNKRNKR